MEQRRLRLGDILDDYCPRERRVTNHAVVAMIEDDVKQTRCTTCDAEHAYKGGREPRRKKKDSTSVLYREVLAGMTDTEAGGPAPIPEAPILADAVAPVSAATLAASSSGKATDASQSPDDAEAEPQDDEPAVAEEEDPRTSVEDGPIHRRLIRATLPRPEGQKIERQEPDFTIRHNTHNGSFRDRPRTRGLGGNGTNGNGTHGNQGRGGRRFAGGGGGGGGTGMPGNRGGQGRPGFGGGSPSGQKRAGRNRRRPR
jgi:hypothetical protein